MKCDIELDRTDLTRGTVWSWELFPEKPGCWIARREGGGAKECTSRGSALRNARLWAKRLGLTVVNVKNAYEE